jgi:signal transduction histidine kinase
LLLAVCAVLLLIGAGYAMLRLQSSYRDLNKSNSRLATVNDSLEQRVSVRTEELSAAYEELKESQVQLVQAEKMSSLGELVAGISHEINTPLWYLMSNSTVIQERLAEVGDFLDIAEKMVTAARNRTAVKEAVSVGLVGMSRKLAAGMKEDIDEAVDLVQDSIEGLEELTELAQSLKDFSRLDRAKQGQFDVNEGLNKTLLIVKNKIKHNATVHKHFGEVPTILCSPSQINQIFLNLIVNAADSLGEQGDIVLHTWVKDDTVGIRVADTGCGIPEDELSKVRDPFFTTKEVGKGTGLGLSVSLSIVESMGGRMEVQSEKKRGSTFTVILPIPEETASES